MRPQGSAAELAGRRRRAAAGFQAGESVGTAAERFDAVPSSVKHWRRAWRAWLEGGEEALAAKPRGGGERKLADRRLDELFKLLIAGPPAAGFPTDLWTCARCVELIRERFGVEYDRRRLAKLHRLLGLRPSKPRTAAREQDSAALERQRRQDGPRKKARRRGVSSVCLDETGWLRQPVNRRTMPPKDVDQLDEAVNASLQDRAADHRLKLSCFKTAQPKLEQGSFAMRRAIMRKHDVRNRQPISVQPFMMEICDYHHGPYAYEYEEEHEYCGPECGYEGPDAGGLGGDDRRALDAA